MGVLHAAGKGNCVIVGRGSQYFLEDRDDTLRVFLYAPRREKVRRVMTRGKSETEAEELVDTVDHDRVAFIQKYFGVEWPTRCLYHLMLNTAVGEDAVVRTILEFMQTLDARS